MVRIALVIIVSCLFLNAGAYAKKGRKKRYTGPPPTHPVLFWARALAGSTDREEKKKAAFKLSQYSQTIFQEEAINAILKCTKDEDLEIKVLCVKALGKTGNLGHREMIRTKLVELFEKEPALQNMVTRVLITRRDDSVVVQNMILEALKKTNDQDSISNFLNYFKEVGTVDDRNVAVLISTYQKVEHLKLKSEIIEILTEKSQGQEPVISLFLQCAETAETTLALGCLGGLQQQGKKDPRVWSTLEKTILSDDPEMILASLDVINGLPASRNEKISERLLSLLESIEDEETLEKTVLALGNCGTQSKPIVETLKGLIENSENGENVRIAAALVIGKQSSSFVELPKEALSKCIRTEKSQTLKTACELSAKELGIRDISNVKTKP